MCLYDNTINKLSDYLKKKQTINEGNRAMAVSVLSLGILTWPAVITVLARESYGKDSNTRQIQCQECINFVRLQKSEKSSQFTHRWVNNAYIKIYNNLISIRPFKSRTRARVQLSFDNSNHIKSKIFEEINHQLKTSKSKELLQIMQQYQQEIEGQHKNKTTTEFSSLQLSR